MERSVKSQAVTISMNLLNGGVISPPVSVYRYHSNISAKYKYQCTCPQGGHLHCYCQIQIQIQRQIQKPTYLSTGGGISSALAIPRLPSMSRSSLQNISILSPSHISYRASDHIAPRQNSHRIESCPRFF